MCAVIHGNAQVTVSQDRLHRGLNVVLDVCTCRNSDVPEDSKQERDLVIDFDH